MHVPTARVIHIHGGTAVPESAFAVYYGNRNRILYVLKNFPVILLITSAPWILGRTIAVIPYYFIRGNGRAILNAVTDSLRMSHLMIKKRKGIKKTVTNKTIKKWILTWASVGKTL